MSQTNQSQNQQPGQNPVGDSSGKTINVRNLVPGSHLDGNVFSPKGVLLLKAGSEVTHQFIQRMHNQGLKQVRVMPVVQKTQVPSTVEISEEDLEGKPSPAGAESAPSKPAQELRIAEDKLKPLETGEEIIKLETNETVRLDGNISDAGFPDISKRAAKARAGGELNLSSLREKVAESIDKSYQNSMNHYVFSIEQMMLGKDNAVEGMGKILQEFRSIVLTDSSLPLLIMQMKSTDEDEYLYCHGLNVALLAMTIVSHLGFDKEAVVPAGISGLFQDLGMMKVPTEIRSANRKLTMSEILEVQRHPIYTLDILEKTHSLNDVTRLICYQHHERCDRSGYPRRRHGMYIHPFAKIMAVADTYTALTCNRPYRPTLEPYDAVTLVLDEVKQGRLDRVAVRAFLDCVSLFPVGSYVKLSDGTNALVVRSNNAEHTRPVVVPLNADGSETDEILDLSKTDQSVKVVSTAQPPKKKKNKSNGNKRKAG